MMEYAVLKIRPDNAVMAVFWGTEEEVVKEAAWLDYKSDDGSKYRAVRSHKFGYFESLTSQSLHVTPAGRMKAVRTRPLGEVEC